MLRYVAIPMLWGLAMAVGHKSLLAGDVDKQHVGQEAPRAEGGDTRSTDVQKSQNQDEWYSDVNRVMVYLDDHARATVRSIPLQEQLAKGSTDTVPVVQAAALVEETQLSNLAQEANANQDTSKVGKRLLRRQPGKGPSCTSVDCSSESTVRQNNSETTVANPKGCCRPYCNWWAQTTACPDGTGLRSDAASALGTTFYPTTADCCVPSGPNGDAGAGGGVGPPGIGGSQGNDGGPGLTGTNGTVGLKGDNGDPGFTGDDGPIGPAGSPGTGINCAWSSWSTWSPCTVTCGILGFMRQDRTVATIPQNGGMTCNGSSFNFSNCPTLPTCTVPITACVWSHWQSWDTCSTTCGGGWTRQERWIQTYPQNFGADCAGNASNVKQCNTQSCIVVADCIWNLWDSWESCTYSCGGGVSMRHRQVQQYSRFNGQNCTGNAYQSLTCNTLPCQTIMVNCVWADWQPWSPCTQACGEGYQKSNRFVEVYPFNNGTNCDGGSFKRDNCSMQPCTTLKTTTTTLTITTTVQYVEAMPLGIPGQRGTRGDTGLNGGRGAPGLASRLIGMQGIQGANGSIGPAGQHGLFGKHDHIVNCSWSVWNITTPCSAACEGGFQTQERYIVQYPENNGTSCEGASARNVPCNQLSCAHAANATNSNIKEIFFKLASR